MAVPIRHKDILKNYVDNDANAAWARDLVSLAIQTGGVMTDKEHMKVLDELEKGITGPTIPLPSNYVDNDPKLKILQLTHVQGVNALANNQDIIFCVEGVTLIYGQNCSGKSGYFRILNQIAGGEINHTLYQNVHVSTPSTIEVKLKYSLDGIQMPVFVWDGKSTGPVEVRHLRFFDSHYATTYLSTRGGNTFFFRSQNLMVYKAINDTLDFLIELGASLPSTVEADLRSLCSTSYRDNLTDALIHAFQDELKELGMDYLQVSLSVGNLLDDSSIVAIKMSNTMNIHGILSEAEQKCAALALFFAECDLMAVKQPIVLDDPVNSLDDIFIERFVQKLSKIENQVIVFSHSVLFLEAMTDIRRFKIFKNSGISRLGTSSLKKHELIYDTLTSGVAYGYIINHLDKKTMFFLDKAQEKLSATPVTNEKGIVDDLRMAVEWAIDEVVFRGLAPRRFKGCDLTDWATMEAMTNVGSNNVIELHDVYDQLSSMGCHLGYMSYVSTATVTKLRNLHSKIETIYRTVYP